MPGQAELVDLQFVKGSVGEFSEVLAGVDSKKLAQRSLGDRGDFYRAFLGNEKIVRLQELFHWEGVACGEWEIKSGVVEAAKARRHKKKDARGELARQTI
jgi:hypothetical protein